MARFAEKLRMAVAQRNWNITDVAKRTGYPHSTLRNLIKGYTQRPDPYMLRDVAYLLGYTLDELLSDGAKEN